MKDQLTICIDSSIVEVSATQLAERLSLNILPIHEAATPFVLNYKEGCTELIDQESNTAIHVDFLSGSLAHRKKYGGGQGQAIAKAIGIKKYKLPLNILDVTTGLAKDAFVLACLGCSVTMVERHPIIAELVRNALEQAEKADEFQKIKQQEFKLIETDATHYLKSLINLPDVIYMDPMYPERKKSAAVKKNMQILQKLIGHNIDKETDESNLFELALKTAKKRVVVKRPKGAASISDSPPTMTIESKITRYDVYVLNLK